MISLIKKYKKYLIAITIILLPIITWLIIYLQVPKDFPKDATIVHIPQNSSISSVASDLYSKHIINSELLFKIAVKIISNKNSIFAGDYKFTESQNIAVIAYRIVKGQQGLSKIKITIPEGTNTYDMAYIFMKKLENFNAPYFLALAHKNEGYLFPDTYYFYSNTSPEQIIREMKQNFNNKIKSLESEITQTNKTLEEIIIMASIIEEEAKGIDDKSLVSGVLWNRIDKKMLLQVDPPFYYITGKTSGVTFDDLRIDSPYNTYKYSGLPIGPISNPGIESIIAAIKPTPTKYFFYLTGRDGIMRYATTYDGHLVNKNNYLN